VNAKKTVLAGCSNGGYMTMVMAMHHPEMFDAYVPICEAVNDKYISDEQIEELKKLPIYFVYSKDDTTFVPENYEIPTIERLLKAGAENVYVSTTDHVIDTSGLYINKDGTPYKYAGHWSWIYFFNNECDADGLKAWDFVKKYLGV
ncbi:MAG: prolyl oligopeptidase family serine peptidase, partial [Solobacterium sp.]|nr:prolyl oligopeptidase family serine peptidase [Solobacterium sp.]